MHCKKCGHEGLVKDGFRAMGGRRLQRWRCPQCGSVTVYPKE
jgi:transposase-like protein